MNNKQNSLDLLKNQTTKFYAFLDETKVCLNNISKEYKKVHQNEDELLLSDLRDLDCFDKILYHNEFYDEYTNVDVVSIKISKDSDTIEEIIIDHCGNDISTDIEDLNIYDVFTIMEMITNKI